MSLSLYTHLTGDDLPTVERARPVSHPVSTPPPDTATEAEETAWFAGVFVKLRGRDSNPDYLIQSQASYH